MKLKLGTNQQILVDALAEMLKTRTLPISFDELVEYAVSKQKTDNEEKRRLALAVSLNSVKLDQCIVFNNHNQITDFRSYLLG